jgi:uncharacterized OB-fold protein
MSGHELQEQIEEYLQDGELKHKGWTQALRAGVLLGQECEACGHVTGAPKAACARCGNDSVSPTQLPQRGEVFTETTVHVPPEQFDGTYQVGLVTLGDAMIMARLEDGTSIGAAVELEDTIEEDEHPGPLFGSVDESTSD